MRTTTEFFEPVKASPPDARWLDETIDCNAHTTLRLVRQDTRRIIGGILAEGLVEDATLMVSELTGNGLGAKDPEADFTAKVEFGVVEEPTALNEGRIASPGNVVIKVSDTRDGMLPAKINLHPSTEAKDGEHGDESVDHMGLPVVVALSDRRLGYVAPSGDFVKSVWTVLGPQNINN
ncbi:MAG TPA: hypothetical protein VLG47_07895 [Candidatus Saccharimonadales bacterium]|nr:hypothetical protein [Candidatus Saccharimonadales bacterium]